MKGLKIKRKNDTQEQELPVLPTKRKKYHTSNDETHSHHPSKEHHPTKGWKKCLSQKEKNKLDALERRREEEAKMDMLQFQNNKRFQFEKPKKRENTNPFNLPNELAQNAVNLFIKGKFSDFSQIQRQLNGVRASQTVIYLSKDLNPSDEDYQERNLEDLLREEEEDRSEDEFEKQLETDVKAITQTNRCGSVIDQTQAETSLKQEILKERHNAILDKSNNNASEEPKLWEDDDNFDKTAEKKVRKKLERKRREREQKRALGEFKKKQRILEDCQWCYWNNKFDSNAIISESEDVYLLYNYKSNLLKYHLNLLTKDHYISLSSCPENIFTQIRNYMKSLVAFYQSIGLRAIFMETVTNLKAIKHTELECIGVEDKIFEEMKICFYKELSDSDVQWSQHKKIIDSTKKRGNISQVIPQNFPYFHVDFEAAGGYAHVIENEGRFKSSFGREVIGRFLDKDISDILYPTETPTEQILLAVETILPKFATYDWTLFSKK